MTHRRNRDLILDALRAELVGPSPQGQELDCDGDIKFATAEEARGPWRQKDSGEEILQRDPPSKRYGVGVLYPMGTPVDLEGLESSPAVPAGVATGVDEGHPEAASGALVDSALEELEQVAQRAQAQGGVDLQNDDFDVCSANAYRPSSMAISFLAALPAGAVLQVEASGGRYRSKPVSVGGKEWTWWLRTPVRLFAAFAARDIYAAGGVRVQPVESTAEGTDGLDLRIELYSREYKPGQHLLTVALVNRTPQSRPLDEACLFQATLKVTAVSAEGSGCILPYPAPVAHTPDDEEQSLALLYRNFQTFAVGHGCAASWDAAEGEVRARSVCAECLPVVETPSITPDIQRPDGTPLTVPMAALAGLVPADSGFAALDEVVDRYAAWIASKKQELADLDPAYQDAGRRHIQECETCLARMRDGLRYVREDPRARRAFQLANHAMLLQQIRSRLPLREPHYDESTHRFVFSSKYIPPDLSDLSSLPPDRGVWRPFQIAFLLMSARSTAESDDPHRRTVELLWFPTGGGKTEAYLGLAAFAIFMRRLKNQDDAGVHVLMRYTLRLLTAQQFQRASALLCAMEYLRRQYPHELGAAELSIGIWLGGQTTPNDRAGALRELRELQKAVRGSRGSWPVTKNRFVVTRCPWCGAQMGPVGGSKIKNVPKSIPLVHGYEQAETTVVFKCPDSECPFASGLPVYVIDEDIYEKRPSLVIGTVDKFAMLAWRPEARALFGIDPDGRRVLSPPGLIIQDELHLISGPLGSMVGLYESVIEELCTDRREAAAVPPKIICSTATIRRYREQIRALYARERVTLFPSPGLDVSDSFFARYARDSHGTLLPGRMYAGVHAPGLGSLQTAQVRTFSALLQAAMAVPPAERDPWWTLVAFFNSLRELGTSLSLLQSDIPDYLLVLRNRLGLDPQSVRRLRHILELTGRLESDEVPQAIAKLESPYRNEGRNAVDVCLASNIIEAGIDIDRLSLMAVTGQPKTTTQYIQVTGRVGRRWRECPGLVVTIYVPSKPRDRSHFEKFRSYHERLYAQVEPASVTPFSAPALDRALHAVMACYVRQAGSKEHARSPYPYPDKLIKQLRAILLPRVRAIDPDEVANFERVFTKRAREWARWQRTAWDARQGSADIPLLRPAGAYATPEQAQLSWATPQSMRNVDAECRAVISRLYLYAVEGSSDRDE